MKSSGICPKCESKEIYSDEFQAKRGDRARLGISSWTQLSVSTYICADCGYIEEYVNHQDLKDSKKMDKLRSEWKARN